VNSSKTIPRAAGQTVRTLAEGGATAEVRRRKDEAERKEVERQAGITFATFAGPNFFGYEGRWTSEQAASGCLPVSVLRNGRRSISTSSLCWGR
jgi:hypothetical protein